MQLEIIRWKELSQIQKCKYYSFLSFADPTLSIDTQAHVCIFDMKVGMKLSKELKWIERDKEVGEYRKHDRENHS